ncbi:MAG: DUF58 domain-containing protein [bacterium]
MQRTREIAPAGVNARQFAVATRRLANSLVFGTEDSIFHGCGIEYAQPRPYVPGDPIKSMDWKVTARTGRYYVKEYQEPKRMPVYILLDTSASMCVSSGPMSKYEWAVSIGAGLGLAAQMQMSPVGLLGCGQRQIHVKPTLSAGAVMEWAHELRRHGFLEATTFGRRVRELAPSLAARTLVIAITDLHDPDAIPAMKWLGADHDAIVLHLQDPAELGIPGSGFFRGQEAETGMAFIGHGAKTWDFSDAARHQLMRYQVDYLRLRTDEKILPRLRFFMRRRTRGGSGGR